MDKQIDVHRLLHLMVDGIEGYWCEHGYLRYWEETDVRRALEAVYEYRQHHNPAPKDSQPPNPPP
ncbi:MAG: hypothetical protein K8I27_01350 [Planctomycetes bacterium]|nr:hypothetical protein [Planctomycetota bacterium]